MGRDRFVLSAGHGSMLLYSLLHLAGFDCTLEDLKRFRQLGSRTAGHPEFGHLPGVEVTSGPLGQGFANGVGMALGQAMLAAKLGPGSPVGDHFVYGIVSDGDLMEGVAAEAASFAGHNRLGRIVYLYDDNEITIDGKTSIAFTGEDVTRRFEGYGWHVQAVDGRDHEGIHRAIEAAKAETRRPSLVRVRTTIGFGSPGQGGQVLGARRAARRGRAQGDEAEPRLARGAALPRPGGRPRPLARGAGGEGGAGRGGARARSRPGARAHPDQAALLDVHVERWVPERIFERLLEGADAADATRKLSAAAIQRVAPLVPSLVGGSADLAESNLTDIKGGGGRSRRTPRPGGTSTTASASTRWGRSRTASPTTGSSSRSPARSCSSPTTCARRCGSPRSRSSRRSTSGRTTRSSSARTARRTSRSSTSPRCARSRTSTSSVRATPSRSRRRGRTRSSGATARPRSSSPARSSRRCGAAAGFTPRLGAPRRLRRGGAGEGPLHGRRDRLRGPARAGGARPAREEGDAGAARLDAVPRAVRGAAREVARAGAPARAARRGGRGRPRHRVVAVRRPRRARVGIDRFGASAPEKALAEEYGFTPAKVAERIERWLAAAR